MPYIVMLPKGRGTFLFNIVDALIALGCSGTFHLVPESFSNMTMAPIFSQIYQLSIFYNLTLLRLTG